MSKEQRKMFGNIELEEFKPLTEFPQKAASACSALETDDNEHINWTGTKFIPLLYCGKQIVKGVNYWFIAEMIQLNVNAERHLVVLAINEFDGEYKPVKDSFKVIL